MRGTAVLMEESEGVEAAQQQLAAEAVVVVLEIALALLVALPLQLQQEYQ